MKKEYTNPIIEVIVLDAKNILLASNEFCGVLAGDTETDYNTLA